LLFYNFGLEDGRQNLVKRWRTASVKGMSKSNVIRTGTTKVQTQLLKNVSGAVVRSELEGVEYVPWEIRLMSRKLNEAVTIIPYEVLN
jgi:hypothetical protein